MPSAMPGTLPSEVRDEVVPSRYSGTGGDDQPRPASFPRRQDTVTIRGGEEWRSSHLAPQTQAGPQATPPCWLGRLALGQPCAEAVERDVPLAERDVGHQVLRQTVAPGCHHRACRGLGSEAERQPARTWEGLARPSVLCPGALAPQGLHLPAGSQPHLRPPGTSPVVWLQTPV